MASVGWLAMTIYLVRHDKTTAEGLCYGRTDVALAIAPHISAKKLSPQLPTAVKHIFSSPLQRCAKLAVACYPDDEIAYDARLQEANFGDWEATPWHQIERSAIDQWALSPTHMQFPNGESLDEFRTRLDSIWQHLNALTGNRVVFTHAGVIRYFLALSHGQPWQQFLQHPVNYGSVTVINFCTKPTDKFEPPRLHS